MDFLKRPTVAEDAVQYRLFLLHPDPLGVEDQQRFLLRLLEDVLAQVAALLVGYIWQKQPFNLSFHPEKGEVIVLHIHTHTQGITGRLKGQDIFLFNV